VSEPLRVQIRELVPGREPDYLAFFDRDAFPDNPGWAGCYCLFPQAPHATGEWNDQDREGNRAAAAGLIGRGELRGYLAYDGERPVGWCNANLRARYTILDPDDRDPEAVGAIVCFVVAPPYRGRGVARQLLEAACEGFRERGVRVVEAYPRPNPDSDAANHFGPLSMYLAAGFEQAGTESESVVVRKTLA
jgi:GNAT superfamily N-acetyltransferase